MEQFNFGIVGAGRIIAKFCRAFREGLVSGGSILAVASRDINRAREFAAANGISRAYGSYEELLEDRDIDIVYIATTNELHFPCCEKAIRLGKHVLCEKPLTTCAADAKALAAMAKARGVFLMEAMWTRFLPAILKAEVWVREGRLGELRSMRASLCAHREPAEYPRIFDPAKGGGAALDLGIYCLHLARVFAGNRKLLECKSISIQGESGVDLTNYILLEYTGGFVVDLASSVDFSAVSDACLFGETGCVRIDPRFSAAESAELSAFPAGDNLREPVSIEKFDASAGGKPCCTTDALANAAPVAPGFEFQIAHTIECLRRGKTQSDLLPLAHSVEAIEIIDRVRAPVKQPGC